MSRSGPRTDHQPVLLYDGECGLCNAVVRRLLRTDRSRRLKFAPLQSSAAQEYLRTRGLPTADFDSLVFVGDWVRPLVYPPLLKTDGALAAARVAGGWWRVGTWLQVLPTPPRDFVYRLVARSRYAIFGAYRGRPLAEVPEWKDRFVGTG